jgi:hypothetical protein
MNKLTEKLRKAEAGIFLYSLTPPAKDITSEKLFNLNRRRAARISTLDIDGLSIYDVQEEKDRTNDERTYRYRPALNPMTYGKSMNEHSGMQQVIYLVSGKYREEELESIFRENPDKLFVPVGSPSTKSVSLTSLNTALEISQSYKNPIGAVCIGERHQYGRNEVERMLAKEDRGVDFFISQCVFNGTLYEKLLDDYEKESRILNYPLKPVILTFSPVGDRNSLEFMKWLGIEFEDNFLQNLPHSDNFLEYSLRYLEDIGRRLIDMALERDIPLGLNFESVIGRRAEVLASLKLAEDLSDYLKTHSFNSFTRNLKSGVSALSRR